MANLDEIFHDGKPVRNIKDLTSNAVSERRKAKFVIGNPDAFAKSREILGNIISQDMMTSGGMDVDWLVERKGNFIILEIKTFHDDRIRIPLGQIIAYQSLHASLNKITKCYLYVIGVDENDFTNDNNGIWIFEMKEWSDHKIPHLLRNADSNARDGFVVERSFMRQITVQALRNLLESAWKEFGK